jgi:hypothetical protein
MNLTGLRARIAALGREMPALESNTDGPARNVQRLARIAADPKGQSLAATFEVLIASGFEEPADYQALLAGIGDDLLLAAFPDGVPEQTGPAAGRACARAYFLSAHESPPDESDDWIARMAREMIAQVQP